MRYDENGYVHMEYKIPTRGLIGFNAFFVRTTRGEGVKSSIFTSYEPMQGEIKSKRSGALVASETGVAVTYGLLNAQGRGDTFIDPGVMVYQGMIVGTHHRDGDIEINVCKEKKLTNHAFVNGRRGCTPERHHEDEPGGIAGVYCRR